MEQFIMVLLTSIGGLMLAVIGFFLRQTMQEIKEIKKVTYSNKTKIEVMENDYLNKIDNLNQKFDLLYKGLEDLTQEIRELNKKMK
jgi:hypothetical protein